MFAFLKLVYLTVHFNYLIFIFRDMLDCSPFKQQVLLEIAVVSGAFCYCDIGQGLEGCTLSSFKYIFLQIYQQNSNSDIFIKLYQNIWMEFVQSTY